MLYAALGDSITYGYDAEHEENAYVRRMVRALSAKSPVNLFLNAKPGWTSKNLLKSVQKVPDVIWAEAKLVTLLVGGNDLLWSAPWLLHGRHTQVYKVAERLQDNVERIISTVQRPQSTILMGTVYNPFPNSLLVEEYMETVNKAIRRLARKHGVVMVDIERLFKQREAQWIHGFRQGSLKDMRLRANPIHPNERGHAAIAQAFLRAYRRSSSNARKNKRKA